MTLSPEMTLDQFRIEMQHRVVKYALHSRPVKEALRFAKQHSDPAFYRIAADKIHAQRQFQREMFGPTRLERLVDFLTLGSLREVVATLLLVVAGVLGLDMTRRAFGSTAERDVYAHMDVDELAARLGILLEANNSADAKAAPHRSVPRSDAENRSSSIVGGQAGAQLSDTDVQRIAEAVMRSLQMGASPPPATPHSKATQSAPAEPVPTATSAGVAALSPDDETCP